MYPWLAAAALVAAAAVLTPTPTQAASCCGGGSTSSLLALGTWDRALAGVAPGATLDLARRTSRGERSGDPAAYRSSETRLLLVAAARIAPRLQVGAGLPLVLRRVHITDSSSVGTGIGDTELAARWEILRDDHCYAVPITALTRHDLRPELHVVARLLTPTGRSAEASNNPLGADVLGQGAWRSEIGIEASKAWGRGGAAVEAGIGPTWMAARVPQTQRGLRLNAGASLLFYPAYKRYLGITLGQRQTWWNDGARQSETTPGIVAAARFARWWLRANISAPAAIAGRDVPMDIAATVAILYVWGS